MLKTVITVKYTTLKKPQNSTDFIELNIVHHDISFS
jgi:hypothetical protein